MSGQPTLLAALLESKGLQRYGSFRVAYEKAARSLDRERGGIAPSRAQFHRWLTGDLRGLPHTDHCRILEHLLTGYSSAQLFKSSPDGIRAPAKDNRAHAGVGLPASAGVADVTAVFASRSEFAASIEPRALFDGASRIRACGLSLNLICQQVPDQQLRRMLAEGTQIACLFLDPDGEAIKAREREEEYTAGHLAGLNNINIQVMTKLRGHLPPEAQERLHLGVYDETIRFNIILVGDQTCVAQPYLPRARGIDAPVLLMRRNGAPGGMYPVFEQVYEAIAERSRQV